MLKAYYPSQGITYFPYFFTARGVIMGIKCDI